MLAVVVLVLSSCSSGSPATYSLEPGDCFDDPPELTDDDLGEFVSGEFTDLPMIGCNEPHDNEMFALFDAPDGPFPGTEALDDMAVDCVPLFEDYVGASYEDMPQLDIMWIVPTAESWEGGDRRVTCALFDTDFAKLTGSQRDSGA